MTLGTAIILIIVAVLAGYVFGIVDSRVTSAMRKKPSEAAPVVQPFAGEPNRPGERTVLKVNVDQDQKWHLDLNGERLERPEMLTSEQRQRVVNVVIQMRPWLDGKPTASAAAPVTPAPAAPAAPMPASLPGRPVQETATRPMPAPSADNKDDLKISVMRGFSSMITKDVKTAVEKKPSTIVGMINDVLQEQLPGTPYMNQGISLADGPQGEVMVHVGSTIYTGIDAVPDPGIRNVIRAAIATWEKK